MLKKVRLLLYFACAENENEKRVDSKGKGSRPRWCSFWHVFIEKKIIKSLHYNGKVEGREVGGGWVPYGPKKNRAPGSL